MKNSYFDLGLSDFKFSLHGFVDNEYNQVCSLCVQAIEKFLISIIEVKAFTCDSSIFKTHDLMNLIKVVNSNITDFMNDTSGIYSISTMYFEVRYPGDNFYEAEKEDAILCVEQALEVYKKTCVVLDKEYKHVDTSFIYDK